MTVAAQNVALQSVAAPGQKIFPFSWRCDASNLVAVWVNNTQDGGFTVILNADQIAAPGGTITRASAAVGGEVVTIERVSPQTQTTALTKYGPFPSSTITTALDDAIMLAQEAAAGIGRCFKAARSNFSLFSTLELPDPLDGSMIAFQADANQPGKFKFQTALSVSKAYVDGLVQAILGGGAVNAPVSWTIIGSGVANYAVPLAPFASPDLYLVYIDGTPQEPTTSYTMDITVVPALIKFTEVVPLNARIYVRVLGYAKGVNVGDTSLITAAGSVTAATLAARFGRVVNAKDYGVKGDNATDDTLAAAAALAAVTAGVVVFPPGNYRISQMNMKTNVWIYAEGATFTMPNNSAIVARIFNFSAVNNCGILGAVKADGNRANQVNTGNNGSFAVFITQGAADIYIESVLATGFSQDGLYIGGVGPTPIGISIGRWISDNCTRNGVSITNGKNIRFNYLETRGTNGAAPEAGIDFEPNVIADACNNISIGHLVTHDNNGYGIQILGLLNVAAYIHGDLTIERLDCYSNLTAGVLLFKVHHIYILSGTIHDNVGGGGIEIPNDVRHLRVKADIYNNGQRGVNGAMTGQTGASSDWDFSGCVVKNNSQLAGNTQDGLKFDSDDAAKVLTRVRGNNVKLYDDQGVMTQRFGVTTGPNSSDVDIVGYIPANATGSWSLGGVGYMETQRIYLSVTLDHPNILAGSFQILNATVPGAAGGDQVILSPSGFLDGLVYSAFVSAANTVRITIGNLAAVAQDPGPIAWKITVIKH